jgi:uncharacterized protein DUF1592/uncharacterized protein DUF1588/uncharacterized protein DUF1587/uncharacterized protein DUF1595/uncharacterized protein DUF1585
MATWGALLALAQAPAHAADSAVELQRQFGATVRPFLTTYCLGCHGGDKPKGQLDLGEFADMGSVTHRMRRWESVLEMLASKEMPPEKAKPQPGGEARAQVVEWIRAVRRYEAGRTAGDPGLVLARRLTNSEYDYTVRDLTGVDIRPTREFPVDPANETGFDNSGESLVMSPALLKKYLDAARAVSEHAVLGPRGLAFAPEPVLTDTDRDRYTVGRIVRFYQQQPTDLARYFHAAWRFAHRAALRKPLLTLAACAAEEKVSPGYLREVWTALEKPEEVGPLARLQRMFQALPPDEDAARAGCETMRGYVSALREKLSPTFKNLKLKNISSGSQPFVLWKNTQQATHRTSFNGTVLHVAGLPPPRPISSETIKALAGLGQAVTHFSFRNIVHDSALPVPFGVHELAETLAPPDPELAIPDQAARPRYQAAFARFCQVFPDAFYISERARTALDLPKDRREKEAKGRFLAAGFLNMFGLFRDDLPLYQKILDEEGRRELDQLWRDLEFITQAAKRQHADFLLYERGESRSRRGAIYDFLRANDRSATSEAMIRRLGEVYVGSARETLAKEGGDPRTIPVLEQFFENVAANVSRVERERLAAEPTHLASLLAFAGRAYRRPLTTAERAGLLAFYRAERQDGLDHESAIRDALARVLMSPSFLYRVDLVAGGGPAVRALDDHALASRISYFLWSSMPDGELLAHARRNDLHRPQVLTAQVRRMLHDQRARALAVEFGGQWLDFRRFEEHNGVDRERFPTFTRELRQAMFEEPVRFFLDVIGQDRSVLDFLYARHTFVNAVLARHYGMPEPATQWARVDDADRYQRGGILPMAVFLTKNAPGLRTSPVKRGYWVVRRVLGERIPPPPAQVPELPRDERQMGDLTLRQVLAKHRENKSCAGCHSRFDSYGLALEGYGPVGEVRTVDLGGRPVDTRASFAAGNESHESQGLEGLRQHLRAHREGDFLDNLCRKLLSYGLGRGLMLSDESTIRRMRMRLTAEGQKFSVLVRTIVSSPQFLTTRAADYIASGGE